MKKRILTTTLDDKVNELKDGLCILSYYQGDELKCKRTEKGCIVTLEPKNCPAINNEKEMHRLIYGRNVASDA
jgi:hypothetical protein